jgi:hypothetical protein
VVLTLESGDLQSLDTAHYRGKPFQWSNRWQRLCINQ